MRPRSLWVGPADIAGAGQAPGTSLPLDENRWSACGRLVAPNDHVDVERINFNSATNAPGPLGGDRGRARAKEWSMTIAATLSGCNKRSKSRGSNAPLQARHWKYIGITQ